MTEKKVTKRKRVAKKAQPKSVFDRLESSVVGKPIKIANRTFLASLGLVSTMQTEFTKFQSDFEKTFEKLVKDGEKARKRYRAGIKDFREDLRDDVKDLRDDVKDKYGPDVMCQFLLDFIDDHAKRKSDQPFFIYFPLNAPHTPIVPTPEWKGKSEINQ